MNVNLIMFKESGERRDFTLTSSVTTIGRKDDCDIRIPLAEVSRHHAQLMVSDSEVVLKDLDSANGTYVNNRRVKKGKLSPGDHVIVGPVVFTVQVDGNPEEVRAVKTKLRRLPAAETAVAGGSDGPSNSNAASAESNEFDPISALEALASSADQTAIDTIGGEDDKL